MNRITYGPPKVTVKYNRHHLLITGLLLMLLFSGASLFLWSPDYINYQTRRVEKMKREGTCLSRRFYSCDVYSPLHAMIPAAAALVILGMIKMHLFGAAALQADSRGVRIFPDVETVVDWSSIEAIEDGHIAAPGVVLEGVSFVMNSGQRLYLPQSVITIPSYRVIDQLRMIPEAASKINGVRHEHRA